MMNELSSQYATVRCIKKKLAKGEGERMIEKAKLKYNVTDKVSIRTIQSRFSRGKLYCRHRGTTSPMEELEPVILDIAVQRGRMNQPLTNVEGLELANSLICPNSKLDAKVK